jgi:hypothetical protein
MTVLVQHSDITSAQLLLVQILGVVMLPILAIWVVTAYRACSASARRLLAAVLLAASGGGVIQIIINCAWYPWALECWHW